MSFGGWWMNEDKVVAGPTTTVRTPDGSVTAAVPPAGPAEKSMITDPMLVAQKKADDLLKVVQRAEQAWSAIARRRQPDVWREAIDTITNMRVRTHVACIVWFDFFSHRRGTSTWNHLNEYKDAYDPQKSADIHSVRKALVSVGYPVRLAERRAHVDNE